jgi:multiple sugar transport system ATP-binding protein
MAMGNFLKLRGIGKRFGRVEALRSIDLELESDQLLVVLGPTGAGKTTLLRTIAGLEVPEEGTVEMGGQEVTHWPPAERDVAFVLQNFSLYPDWSVRSNLEFPLKAPGRKMDRQEIVRRVEWAAALLRIGDLLDRPAAQLSGGEMQRVAIGRAIVRRPKVFLFDEPLTNLDAKLREALRVELVLLRRELGVPMVYVTHDQVEALSMGDRIAVLSEGRILQRGTPQEVYQRPISPLVARQLGQPAINVFAVRHKDGHWVTRGGVPLMAAEGGSEEMLLGVRPEDIAPQGGQVPGKVRVVEDTGPAWIVLVEWAGQGVHLLAEKGRRFRPGEEIYPKINAGRAVLWEG